MSFSPNRTDHYFPQELLVYTEEGESNFLPQEGKIYVLIIVMFEWY